jgi:hypothetical protein
MVEEGRWGGLEVSRKKRKGFSRRNLVVERKEQNGMEKTGNFLPSLLHTSMSSFLPLPAFHLPFHNVPSVLQSGSHPVLLSFVDRCPPFFH